MFKSLASLFRAVAKHEERITKLEDSTSNAINRFANRPTKNDQLIVEIHLQMQIDKLQGELDKLTKAFEALVVGK